MNEHESTQPALILVVDDDESIRTYLRTVLTRHGHLVIEAADGKEALQKSQENPPSLVLSDILMPVMDGYQLCMEWKKDHRLREIPFIFHTGTYLDEDDEKLARSLGADDFLSRPIQYKELLRRIDDVLQKNTSPSMPAHAVEHPHESHFQQYRSSLIRKLEHKMEELKKAKEKIQNEYAEKLIVEQKLRESEELFRAVFEQHSAVKLLIDPDTGNILDANIAAEKFYGWSRETLRTMRIQQINTLPPAQVKEEMERVRKQKKIYFNFQHRRADGSIRDVEVFSTAIKIKNREFLHSIIHDVTDKIIIEHALKESEEKYRSLVENAPCLICTIYPDGTTAYVNSFVESITGYKQSELIGKNWWDIFYPADLRVQVDALFVSFQDSDVNKYVMTLSTKNGTHRTIEWNSFNEYAPDGSIRLINGIGIDVTERIKAEEQLKQLTSNLQTLVESRTAELKKSNEDLESFVYSVAHDLRAPVRHISGFMQFLKNELGENKSEKIERFLDIIGDSAQHMSELIDGLLNFARIGKITPKTERVDLRALVREVLEDFREDILRKNIAVHCDELHIIQADRTLMRTVLVNLIGNAIKFSNAKECPEIEIASRSSETEDIISVRDNGVGFDMQYANKLFGIFQRLHSEKEFAGTGIGLASVRQIINRHGGRVWAEGETGKGACFYFSIPKAKPLTNHIPFHSQNERR